MKKFVNHHNYIKLQGKKIIAPKQTIDNQAYTVAELLFRMQGGLGIAQLNLQYPENEDDIQLRAKDLTDIDEYTKQYSDLRRKEYNARFEQIKKQEREKLLAELEAAKKAAQKELDDAKK